MSVKRDKGTTWNELKLRSDLFDWLDRMLMEEWQALYDEGDEEGSALLLSAQDEILNVFLDQLLKYAGLVWSIDENTFVPGEIEIQQYHLRN